MRNVYSWLQALGDGYNPSEYSYEDVPVGTFRATLDFKIWSKNVSAIICYFTIKEDGKKIQKMIFRNRKTKEYVLDNGDIDFAECPVGVDYIVTINVNSKGKTFIKDIKIATP